MDIEEAKQIVSKYKRNSLISILYNEAPLKLVNNKLVANYLPSNIEDGSWSTQLEEYTESHKTEVIEYFKAREIVFQDSLKAYDRKHDKKMAAKK